MSSTLKTQFPFRTREVIDSVPQLDYSPYYVARRKSGWTAFLKEGRDFTIDNQNCYWSIEGAEQLRNLLLYFHHSKCKTSSDLNRQMIEIQDGYKLTESSLASQKISHFDRDYVLWHWYIEHVRCPDELITKSF